MAKLGIFMANGCEEIEGLAVVDVVRRAGLDIDMISISDERKVTGSHQIVFEADLIKKEAVFSDYDGIILPGGMPGTLNLKADETVQKVIREFDKADKLVAAICAAPSILGEANLLQGMQATCHPGFEETLLGASSKEEPVVTDGHFITSRGMGTAVLFGLEIVRYFEGDEAVAKLRKGIAIS